MSVDLFKFILTAVVCSAALCILLEPSYVTGL